MKLKAGSKVHYEAGPNMTPLVDIVMVILIFLMLTGTFAVGERFIKSNMPITKKGLGGAPATGIPPAEPLDIRVDSSSADAWIAQAGQITVRSNKDQLTAQLNKMREFLNRNNTTTDKIQVQISPGHGTRWRHLIDVYEAALEAKFEKISFTTAH
jgi:biopolymer transport protein ExbD